MENPDKEDPWLESWMGIWKKLLKGIRKLQNSASYNKHGEEALKHWDTVSGDNWIWCLGCAHRALGLL